MADKRTERKRGWDLAGKIIKKVGAFIGILLFMAIFCLAVIKAHDKRGELQITMLDVGQGDGIYIKTPAGKHYLIDGGSSDVTNVGTYRIEPYLESQGVEALDYVFVSHGDGDHTSGIEEMLANQKLGIQIHTIVLPNEQVIDDALYALAELASENGTKVVIMEVGDAIEDEKSFSGNQMLLTCVAPFDTYEGEIGNASSMVLDLQYGEFDMLFTGDLEKDGEEIVVDSGILRDYDVLKVGHHGSKYATSEKFLEQVKPEIALISAGRENAYGHPSEETLERLEDIGCEVYSTQECGAITIRTDGENMRVDGFTH